MIQIKIRHVCCREPNFLVHRVDGRGRALVRRWPHTPHCQKAVSLRERHSWFAAVFRRDEIGDRYAFFADKDQTLGREEPRNPALPADPECLVSLDGLANPQNLRADALAQLKNTIERGTPLDQAGSPSYVSSALERKQGDTLDVGAALAAPESLIPMDNDRHALTNMPDHNRGFPHLMQGALRDCREDATISVTSMRPMNPTQWIREKLAPVPGALPRLEGPVFR